MDDSLLSLQRTCSGENPNRPFYTTIWGKRQLAARVVSGIAELDGGALDITSELRYTIFVGSQAVKLVDSYATLEV
jgi:hypothetical protein